MSPSSISAPPQPETKASSEPVPEAAPPAPVSPQPAPVPATQPPKKKGAPWLVIALILAAAAGAIALLGRHPSGGNESANSTVAVTKADREDLIQDLWLSAEFRPFQEISLHAKVAGYLKSISVDVGDQVKAGQKIAELEVPELEDELAKDQFAYHASLEEVKRAEADFAQAKIVYERLQGISKDHPKLVAQQELDDARAKNDGMKGSLGAAQQRVDEHQSQINKTKTLIDYATIVVPFEGVITRRYADPGALIQAGTTSSTQSMPLVDLAQQDLLRLVFPVPESNAPLIHNGAPVEVTVSALNETFPGKISRFSGKVERNTRTMHTEVDVPNPDNRFKPGMYAYVRLILQEEKNALSVPVQAVTTGDKPTVYVVNKDGVVEQRPVVVGLRTPDKVQIREGLSEGDQVIVGSRTGAQPGQKVIPKLIEVPKAS